MNRRTVKWIISLSSAVLAIAWWAYPRIESSIDGESDSLPKIVGTNAQEKSTAGHTSDETVSDERAVMEKRLGKSSGETNQQHRERVQKFDACRTDAIAWLKGSDEPDDLFAASLLMRSGPDNLPQGNEHEALNTIKKAIERSPYDPLLRMTALAICQSIRECDRTEYINGIKYSNSKNMLGQLLELDQAQEKVTATDTNAEHEKHSLLEKALPAIAKADRLNLYWRESTQRAARGIANSRAVPAASFAECKTYNFTHVLGTVGALPLPQQLMPIVNMCKQSRGKQYQEHCQSISLAMQRGDTLLSVGGGLVIDRGIVLPGSTEDAELTEEWNRFKWLMEKHSELMRDTPLQDGLLDMANQAESEEGNELDVMRAMLREHSIPLEPPKGWQPETPMRYEPKE
jgi:hypothetical protein